MRRHPDVRSWICVGDLPDAAGRYEAVDAPLYFIKGNNENFDLLASGELPDNLHYLPNAVVQEVDGVTIAGLGGTLAPTWYDTPAAELPHPKKSSARATSRDDKRRHFVREEVEACRMMRGVGLFLSHEAPRPFRVGRIDAGKTPINEVLAAMQPRLHLFGHHHRFSEQDRQGVRSVGLDLVSRSYVLIDVETLTYEQRPTDPPSRA
jgi:Icc-related predicted phosphoesterase